MGQKHLLILRSRHWGTNTAREDQEKPLSPQERCPRATPAPRLCQTPADLPPLWKSLCAPLGGQRQQPKGQDPGSGSSCTRQSDVPFAHLAQATATPLVTRSPQASRDAAPHVQPVLGLRGFSKAGRDLGDHLIQPLLGFGHLRGWSPHHRRCHHGGLQERETTGTGPNPPPQCPLTPKFT